MALNAELLTLTANRLPETAELGVHELVDRVSCRLEIVVHPFLDLLPRETIPRVHATIPRVSSTTTRHSSPLASHAPRGADRSVSPWSAAQEQSGTGANRQPHERGCKQIVLCVALVTRAGAAATAADAWPGVASRQSPAVRAGRACLRRIHRRRHSHFLLARHRPVRASR
jgi:hypothetical protein